MAAKSTNSQDVFINCRFDNDWNDKFEAIAFAIIGCGFRVRCAREVDDAGGTRISKLYKIIRESRYGIHDISCVQLDPNHNLPRFNMPLEVGIFLAAKEYGGISQKDKKCLIFDRDQYRYQIFISDLNGMDITAHNDDVNVIITSIRNFLFTSSRRKTIPTAAALLESYQSFQIMRQTCAIDATFADYELLAIEWITNDVNIGN